MGVFAVFDRTTGKLRVVRCSAAVARLQPRDESEGVLPCSEPVSGRTHWVTSGAVLPRPEVTGLTDVPTGTRVFVDGVDYGICDDGAVEIESDISGTYHVRLEPPFPYLPMETDVVIA